jgi:transcriptional regulator with XRE-family HTH domain
MGIPVFDELKELLQQSKLPLGYVVHRSGVARDTLRRWLTGDVYTPRIDTMLKVAAVLGQHIELTDRVKTMVAYYPKPTIRPAPPIPFIGMTRHDVRMTMLKLT